MRITQNTTANLVLNNLQTILSRQAQLEQQASTGVKLSSPGDDPVAAQQVLNLKSLSAAQDQYARNITGGTAILTMSDSAMSGMGGVLARTKELALQMASGTNNPDAQSAAIKELDQLKQQMITLGNTQLNGKFIFGGFKNDTAPFDVNSVPSGNFVGTHDDIQINIERGTKMTVTYPGDTLMGKDGAPGSVDVMAIFDRLDTALTANSPAGVKAELDNIDKATSQVLVGRSVMGARMTRLTSVTSVGEDMQLTTSKVLSGIQDVDYAQVISDLSKQATAYQSAIAASAKVAQMSLLDYLK